MLSLKYTIPPLSMKSECCQGPSSSLSMEQEREREGKGKALVTILETLQQLGPKSPDKEQWVASAVKESTAVHILSLLLEDSMHWWEYVPFRENSATAFR